MNLTEFRVTRRINKSETIVRAASALDAWKHVTGSSSGYRTVKEGSGWTVYPTSNDVAVGRVMEALEWALDYAARYWMSGQESRSEYALTLLLAEVERLRAIVKEV